MKRSNKDEFKAKYESLGGGTGCPKPRPDGTESFDPDDLARPYTPEEMEYIFANIEELVAKKYPWVL